MFSALAHTDVLAIRRVDDHLCVGNANSLALYDIESQKPVARLDELFEHENIHSITRGPGDLLFVHGGKSLGVCRLAEAAKPNLEKLEIQRFPDWIIAVGWTEWGSSVLLSVLFARNNLVFYHLEKKAIGEFWCAAKCILYGGSLLAKVNGKTIVFGGTAFREILIWQADVDEKGLEECPVLHRLKGHEGVIFSVIYEETKNLLHSTSDDRTIRLWEVKNENSKKSEEEKKEKKIDWKNCKIVLSRTLLGHGARVWRSILRKNRIISVGEDSLTCFWSLDGKLLEKIPSHSGANIWCLEGWKNRIFTGGADGAINIWSLPAREENSVQEAPIYVGHEEKHPKFVFFTNSRNILIFLEGGKFLFYEKAKKRISGTFQIDKYANYCVMQRSRDRTKIAIGSIDGHVEIYQECWKSGQWTLEKKLEKRVADSKILSLHWLCDEAEKIAICVDGGRILLLGPEVDEKRRFLLPSSRERWTTAAIVMENLLICGDRVGNVCSFELAGNSNICPENVDFSPSQIFSKIHGRLGVQSLQKIDEKQFLSTGRDGVCRFWEIDEKAQTIRSLHIVKMEMDWVCTALRENDDFYVLGFKEVDLLIYSLKLKRVIEKYRCGGGHRSWDIEICKNGINFVWIQKKSVFHLDEKIGNDLPALIPGFHGKEINSVRGLEKMGRKWIFLSASEDCSLRLSKIEKTENSCSKSAKYEFECLQIYEGHISTIKAIDAVKLTSSSEKTRFLVISGGGRCQLKIWLISVENRVEKLSKDHVTCAQLSSYMLQGNDRERKRQMGKIDFSGFFFNDPETRFMDISAKLFANSGPEFAAFFVACSDGTCRPFAWDLRKKKLFISDFALFSNRCLLKIHFFAPKKCLVVATFGTDGFLDFWNVGQLVALFSRQIREFPAKNGEKMDFQKSDNFTSHKTNFYTEKMNCNLEKIDFSGEKTDILPFFKFQIHRSGVNSYDFRKFHDFEDDRWLLLTGGDDNMLSLVLLEFSGSENELLAKKVASWTDSSVHCAQITGVQFLGNDRFVSVGIDQRVIVHSFSYASGEFTVVQTAKKISVVSDVHGATVLPMENPSDETQLCIYGKGLETMILQ